jgi:hypothetical protein
VSKAKSDDLLMKLLTRRGIRAQPNLQTGNSTIQ